MRMLISSNFLKTKIFSLFQIISKKTWLLLFVLFFTTIFLRYMALRGYKLIFWFDQARDAYLSQQIINNHDLKIFGPSASGTNDTIYHGVLYYYFVAPFYYLSNGDPLLPAFALSVLGALGIFPLFFFSKSLFRSNKISWLTVIAFTFSAELIQLSHWLSNPSLAVMPLIVFYWSLWETGYKNRKQFIIPLAIALGVCLQSAIWLVYLFGPLLIAILYNWDQFKETSVFRNWRQLITLVSFTLVIIATILIGQYMLWHNQIFNLQSLKNNSETFNIFNQTVNLFSIYLTKNVQSLIPSWPIISLVFIYIIFFQLSKQSIKQKIFFLSWILAPLWLFIIEWRNNIHMLISIEIAVIMLFATSLIHFWQSKRSILKIISIIVTIIFVISNLRQIQIYRNLASNIFSPQKGTDLSMQKSLIDYTYQQANGEDFSFSIFSNPYGYSITWAYLYNWYGKQKYSYLPSYVGPDQNGLFGADLLTRSDIPRDHIHFTIIEPGLESVPNIIYQTFLSEQEEFGPVIDQKQFGSTFIYTRRIKQ